MKKKLKIQSLNSNIYIFFISEYTQIKFSKKIIKRIKKN